MQHFVLHLLQGIFLFLFFLKKVMYPQSLHLKEMHLEQLSVFYWSSCDGVFGSLLGEVLVSEHSVWAHALRVGRWTWPVEEITFCLTGIETYQWSFKSDLPLGNTCCSVPNSEVFWFTADLKFPGYSGWQLGIVENRKPSHSQHQWTLRHLFWNGVLLRQEILCILRTTR